MKKTVGMGGCLCIMSVCGRVMLCDLTCPFHFFCPMFELKIWEPLLLREASLLDLQVWKKVHNPDRPSKFHMNNLYKKRLII